MDFKSEISFAMWKSRKQRKNMIFLSPTEMEMLNKLKGNRPTIWPYLSKHIKNRTKFFRFIDLGFMIKAGPDWLGWAELVGNRKCNSFFILTKY